MKILLIHNYYRFRGGEETYVESLSNLLTQKGHDLYLYTKNSKDIEKKKESKLAVAKNLFWNSTVENELSQIIKKFNPDIAHFNNIFPLITPTAYNVCKKFKIPIIQSVHNYRFLCPKGTLFRNNSICELCVKRRFKYPSIIYKCYQNSHVASSVLSLSLLFHDISNSLNAVDHFIFPSEFTLKYHLRHQPNLKNKSSCIPYFVPKSRYNKSKSLYFLYLGRFSEEKGIEELLNIFASLPHISFKAVGDGPLKKRLQIKYRNYKNISFFNYASRKQVDHLLQNAICVVIPSKWYEVLPFVYLEALSKNIPVLTPRTDVFKRLIEKNDLFYYELNDFNDLKNKIMALYAARGEKYIYKFSEEYSSRFTPQIYYKNLLKIYKRFTN